MIEGIYIIVAVLLFFAQLKNGFIMAFFTAVLWPIVFPLMSIHIIGMIIFETVKDRR